MRNAERVESITMYALRLTHCVVGYGATQVPPNAALTTRWTETTVHVPLALVQGLIPRAILTSDCTSATLVWLSPFTSHGDVVGGGGDVPLLSAGAAIG